jgi:hypothetical protein
VPPDRVTVGGSHGLEQTRVRLLENRIPAAFAELGQLQIGSSLSRKSTVKSRIWLISALFGILPLIEHDDSVL